MGKVIGNEGRMCNVLTSKFVLFLYAVLIITAPDAHAADQVPVEEGTLLIGLVVPNSGPERERGEEMRNGATLAVESINLAGGIHGAKLALKVEESGAEVQSQLKAFSALAGRQDLPVVISAGEDSATVTQGVADINQTLTLSNSMRSEVLKGGSFTLRIGRPVGGTEDGVLALMRERKLSRVSALRGDQSWAENTFVRLMDKASTASVQVQAAGRIWNSMGRPADDVMSRLKSAKPELLYLVATGAEQAQIVDSLRADGISSPMVSLFSCSAATVSEELKKYRGTLYSVDVAVDARAPEYIEMSEKFSKRFPKLEKSLDTIIAYDAVHMIAAAYRAGVGSGPALRDFILKEETFKGAAGVIKFTEDGDSRRPVMVNTIQDGVCKQLLIVPESNQNTKDK